MVDIVSERSAKDVIAILVAVDDVTNTLFAGIMVPPELLAGSLKGWLEDVVSTVVFTGCSFESLRRDAVKVRYPLNGEYSAFKLQDQVVSAAFHKLKSAGIYTEPDEEYEYVFDDME